MEISFSHENREFLRVRARVPVRYKFLSSASKDAAMDEIYEGVTCNLSGGGLLLKGRIPNDAWIPELLMEKIVIGVNIFLTDAHEPVKALTRVAWVNTPEKKGDEVEIGLKFKEITRAGQDRIFQFILEDQLHG
jgi:c-di-GMP-binding flagellar brake protein YcgR